MAKNPTLAAVTPAQIETARQDAVQKLARAYLPGPVRQPDGSTIQICPQGRISRAYRLISEALVAEDQKRADALTGALQGLYGQVKPAVETAERATLHYEVLCRQTGQEPEELRPAACECEECVRARGQAAMFAAQARLGTAVWTLFSPDDHGEPYPLIVKLVEAVGDENKRRWLWQLVEAAAAAAKEYGDACRKMEADPDWMRVFR